MAAREDAGERWFEIVLAKECQADIFDVGDGFEDGAEREAKGRGHGGVGREIRKERRYSGYIPYVPESTRGRSQHDSERQNFK